MNDTIKTVLVFILCLPLVNCGGSDQSTPKTTIESARSALEEHDWDRLYDVIHPKLRAKQIPRWRNHLIELLKSDENSTSVGPSEVKEFTNQQIFRTYLESLSRSPRFGRLLDQYESADYTIERPEEGKAVVTFSSRFPIPFKKVILTSTNSYWLVREVNH